MNNINDNIQMLVEGREASERVPQGDLPIGDIIRQTNNLSAEQVEKVLAHQRSTGMKFGEAAVALGLATLTGLAAAYAPALRAARLDPVEAIHG